jgi:hypothetical protein
MVGSKSRAAKPETSEHGMFRALRQSAAGMTEGEKSEAIGAERSRPT